LSERRNIRALADEELVKAFCREEDKDFLEELYGRYIRFVFLICMKYIKNEEKSKDLTMQVFEKLTGDLKRFEVRNFKSWLHVVTKNTCFMQLRSEKGLEMISLDEKKEFQKNMENSAFLHPEEDDNHELNIEQLQSAIRTLDAEQKQCIELFYLNEKSYKEVAEITGYSLNEVKSHIQNGKRNLKNTLLNNSELMIWLLFYFLLNNGN
jgi:RNA polymerase sigma factor (sigma-70 family)